MVERLRALREPVAVVLLLVLLLRLVVAVVGAVDARGSGVDGASAALALVASQVSDPLTVVVLTYVIGSCVLWSPTRHARGLALWALVLVVLGVVLSLLATIGLLATGTRRLGWTDGAGLVLGLVLPVLAVLALSALLQARREEAVAPLSVESGRTADPAGQRQVEPSRDPANEPVWQPDQAAGAAWLKAGDAASGAAASGWGAPGGAGGWAPGGGASGGDGGGASGGTGDWASGGTGDWAPAAPPTGPRAPGAGRAEQDQQPSS